MTVSYSNILKHQKGNIKMFIIDVWSGWFDFPLFSSKSVGKVVKNGCWKTSLFSGKWIGLEHSCRLYFTYIMLYWFIGDLKPSYHQRFVSKRWELPTLPEHLRLTPVFGKVCVVYLLVFCAVVLSSSCVLCTQYCHCVWIIHSWLPHLCSLSVFTHNNSWWID